MTASAPDPKRRKFPLAAQADEANRILTDRYRVCSARVKSGDMTQADADDSIALARAMRDTLRLFATYEDEIRAVLEFQRQRALDNAEIDELKKNPAVGAVLSAFPDSDVALPRRPAPADLPQNDEHPSA